MKKINNGHWRTRACPKAETNVLLVVISQYDNQPHVCIGQYFPKGYEIDWNPTEERVDWVKYTEEDTWVFTEDMWSESYLNYEDIRGYWLEKDKVVAWKPLPDTDVFKRSKMTNFGETE